jgi:hypothetical protein
VPGGFKGKEAQSGFDASFDEAVILLDNVVEVFDLPQFDCLGKRTDSFEVCNGLGIGGILIDIDHTRSQRSGVRISRRGLFHLFFDRMDVRS